MGVEDVQAQVARMADLAWAAAVLDLHGNFSASERQGRKGHYQPRITFRPRATDGRAATELERILGGKVTRAAAGAKGKPVWTLSGGKACLAVIEELAPYMRLRARRAQVLAELCRRIRDFKPASFDERALPIGEIADRAALRDTLLRL